MDVVNEADFAEIEKVLLYVSEARERAGRALRALEKNEAEQHLLDALEQTDRELAAVGRSLMQRTYFAVPKAHSTL
jgi:hypothetical protein